MQVYSISWWWAAIAVHDLRREVVALGDLGADGGVRALDLVVDGLADVVEQAAGLRDLDVGADLGGDHRGQPRCLDDVVEHVLAVARPVLQPAEELDQLRRQARHAGLVGGRLAGLADDQVDLGAGLGDDLLDPAGVDPAVADELRQREPGDLAADRVEARQDDRLRGVVDDQVDAGRLLEGPDVAALAADDPALHLVVREMDDGDRVLGGVVGGDALDRGHDDVAGLLVGLLAGPPLDRAGELDGVVLGLLADGLEEEAFASSAETPLTRSRASTCSWWAFASSSRVLSRSRSRSRSLRSRCSSMSVRWSSCSSRWSRRRSRVDELVAPRAGLVLGLALDPELLVLRLEDQLLLAGSRLGLDPAGLGLGRLHRLRGEHAAGDHAEHGSADGGDDRHRDDDRCVHLYLPSGARAPEVVDRCAASSRRERRHRPMGRSWGGDEHRFLGRAARTTLLKSGA